MSDVTVTLSRTYGETGKQVKKLIFREPKWSDYMAIGDIEEWQPVDLNEGRAMLMHHTDRVQQYAETLLKEPFTPADLAVLNLADTFKVQSVITDFFKKARAPQKKPTASSGDTEKDSPKSAN